MDYDLILKLLKLIPTSSENLFFNFKIKGAIFSRQNYNQSTSITHNIFTSGKDSTEIDSTFPTDHFKRMTSLYYNDIRWIAISKDLHERLNSLALEKNKEVSELIEDLISTRQ